MVERNRLAPLRADFDAPRTRSETQPSPALSLLDAITAPPPETGSRGHCYRVSVLQRQVFCFAFRMLHSAYAPANIHRRI